MLFSSIEYFFFFVCTHYFHSAIFRDGLLLICLFHSSFIYFLTFAFCRHAKSMVQYYWRRSPDTIIHRCLSRFIVSGPKYLPTVTGKKCQFYKKRSDRKYQPYFFYCRNIIYKRFIIRFILIP